MDDSSGSGGNSGLSKPVQIGIIVGCVVVALAILSCIICFLIRRKRAKKQARNDAEDGKGGISIIGKGHNIRQDELELKDMSRKISSVGQGSAAGDNKQEYDALLENGNNPNHVIQSSSSGQHSDGTRLLTLPEPNSWTTKSTYLDFRGEDSVQDESQSRRSSRSSQEYSMDVVDSNSKHLFVSGSKSQKLSAPLAVAESYHSIVQGGSTVSGFQTLPHPGEDRKRNPSLPKKNRPYSEATNSERKFVPNLPLKKKNAGGRYHHKSASHLSGNGGVQSSSSNDGDRVTLNQQVSTLSTRSENCLLTVNEDLDYDELSESEHAPILPAKSKPSLPPKQLVGKSQDDLARIEQQIKTSVSELRQLEIQKKEAAAVDTTDIDYDYVNEDTPDSALGNNDNKRKKSSNTGGKDREFMDYDEPISHSNLAENDDGADYDDPPNLHVGGTFYDQGI